MSIATNIKNIASSIQQRKTITQSLFPKKNDKYSNRLINAPTQVQKVSFAYQKIINSMKQIASSLAIDQVNIYYKEYLNLSSLEYQFLKPEEKDFVRDVEYLLKIDGFITKIFDQYINIKCQ